MNLKQLEYFVTTSQENSISKAAEKLYISQPSLSYSLISLEKELGIKLMERSKQGISLTSEGQAVLQDSKQILNLVSGWKQFAQNRQESCDFKLSGRGFIADIFIPKLMAACRKQFNSISFHATENSATSQITKLSPKNRESAMVFEFINTKCLKEATDIAADNGWKSQMLKTGQDVVLINSNSHLAGKKEIFLQELLDSCHFVTHIPFEYYLTSYEKLASCFHSDSRIEVPSREAALKLVSLTENAITSASFLSYRMNEYISREEILPITIVDYCMESSLMIFYTNEHPEAVKQIISTCKQLL